MTGDEILKLMVEKNVSITPVIKIKWKKNKSYEVVHWVAGYKRLDFYKYTNLILQNEYALGKTPQEAVENLINGKTKYIWVDDGKRGGGYVKNPDHPVKNNIKKG